MRRMPIISRPNSFRQLGLMMMACVLFAIVNFQRKLRPFLPSVPYTAVQRTTPKPETSPTRTAITGISHPVLLERHSDAKPSGVFFRNRGVCKFLVKNNSVPLYVRESLALIDQKMAALTSTPYPNSVERAALCVVQKDEDWYLQEWIDYHLAQGFTDIYIFNHGNADIAPTLQIHPLPVNTSHKSVQIIVYNACLKIIQQRKLPENGSYDTTWVAFLDVDEFLVLKKHETIQAFMADHCPHKNGLCGSVGINWQWFGTSNQTYFEPRPVTQRFLYRDYQPHKIIKSIIRVDELYCMTSAHFPHFWRNNPLQNKSQPPFSYDTRGGILWGPYSHERLHDVAVVNHYTNSLEEWYARRCQRGDVNLRRKNRRCNGKFPGAGYVYDDSASQFYQTHVLDRNPNANLSLVRPPPWKHYPESEFGIQEIVPLSQIVPETPNEEIKSLPKNKTGNTDYFENRLSWPDWKKQIPPAILQSHLPKGFPEPPLAKTIHSTSSQADYHSIPPFIQKRYECIAHVRQLHQERFDSILKWTHNNTTQQPMVLYVDPAYHNNVGDGLLTLGTLTFLLRQGMSDIQQCHYWQSLKRVPPCEEVVPGSNNVTNGTFKLAVWQPGGNWGDLWVNAHGKRIRSFSMLLQNGYSVFGFPQTVVYRNQTRAEAEAQIVRESIGMGLQVNMDVDQGVELAKSRVTLSWREQKSYEVACKLYPFVTSIIVPDIAFQLGPFDVSSGVPEENRFDVVLFMRNDRESVIRKYRSQPSLISEIFRKVPGIKRDLNFTIVDWGDRLKLFSRVPAHHVTKEALYLVSMGKVIVADRLHATILAYLSGVPVVFIDQVTGKISKALDIAFRGLDGCWDVKAAKMRKASNFTHALELAARLVVEKE